jgi:hypothetical protein
MDKNTSFIIKTPQNQLFNRFSIKKQLKIRETSKGAILWGSLGFMFRTFFCFWIKNNFTASIVAESLPK